MTVRSKPSRPRQPIIFLTGFSGSGKSTIAPLLARLLGWSFMDTDAMIEKKYHHSIARLFELHGEEWFREIEAKLIRETGESVKHPTVIALGGGALLRRSTCKYVTARGSLVYLRGLLVTLQKRLKHKSARPLIPSDHGKPYRQFEILTRMRQLLRQRLPGYQSAHFEIGTDLLPPKKVAERIADWYRSAHEAD